MRSSPPTPTATNFGSYQLLQRRLRWFGHAARQAPGEFVRELINPDVPRTWRNRTVGQMKTLATTLKEDLVRLIGPAVVGIRRWTRNGRRLQWTWPKTVAPGRLLFKML